jgi:hypothetical protein
MTFRPWKAAEQQSFEHNSGYNKAASGDTMKTQGIAFFFALCCALAPTLSSAGAIGTTLSTTLHELPASSCSGQQKAEEEANNLALKSAQTYCRSEGYGWRAASIKTLGNLDCRPCDSGGVQCGYAKASLECRKAEPKLSWIGGQ